MITLVRRCVAVVVLLMLASCATTSRSANKERYTQKITEARLLHEQGEVDAAISLLQTWVDTRPYEPTQDTAYELIVEWLLELNRTEEAKRVGSFFLAHYPQSPSANRIIKLFDNQKSLIEKHHEAPPPAEPETMPEKSGGDNPMDSVLDKERTTDAAGTGESNYFVQHGIEANRVVDFNTIGVLLPLSGSFALFGKKALAAMGIAWDVPVNTVKAGITTLTKDGVRIIIGDTKGDLRETEAVLDKLVKEHHVALVVGDITNEPSLLAAQRCQQYGVPMLSLSRHASVSQLGDYIFMVNASPTQQIERLVDHAMKVEGHKRFAILYPKHNYGMSMTRLFYDEVLKKGGTINGIEAYEVHDTNFTDPVKKLVGKYYLTLRPEVDTCAKTGPEAHKCRNNINPVVDFDALFIPDFQKLSLVIPALELEDILITNNPRARATFVAATKIGKPQYVQLLGASSWHDEAVLNKIAPHIDGAYFVDSFSFDESDALKHFVDAFKKVSGQDASTLEVFAHDAAALAWKMAAAVDKPTSRKELRDRIAKYNGPVGLLSHFSFLPNGELDAPETGFRIVNGAVELVAKPRA